MQVLNTPNAVYWDTGDQLALYRLEIERLEALLRRADAVIFDCCGAGCRAAKEPPQAIEAWAEMSVERYLSVNPECRPRRVTLPAIG